MPGPGEYDVTPKPQKKKKEVKRKESPPRRPKTAPPPAPGPGQYDTTRKPRRLKSNKEGVMFPRSQRDMAPPKVSEDEPGPGEHQSIVSKPRGGVAFGAPPAPGAPREPEPGPGDFNVRLDSLFFSHEKHSTTANALLRSCSFCGSSLLRGVRSFTF